MEFRWAAHDPDRRHGFGPMGMRVHEDGIEPPTDRV
jgi:hypothetical protein